MFFFSRLFQTVWAAVYTSVSFYNAQLSYLYIQGCQLKGVSREKAVVMNIAYVTYFGDKLQTFPGLLGNVCVTQ